MSCVSGFEIIIQIIYISVYIYICIHTHTYPYMCITQSNIQIGEGNGTPLQYSCLKNPMEGGAWWAAVHGVARNWTRLSDFTLFFHLHALEKEMATHSSVLAWRIPGTGEPGELPSMGSHMTEATQQQQQQQVAQERRIQFPKFSNFIFSVRKE